MKTAKLGRPVELPGAWGEMANEVGGSQVLANRLSVSVRTLQRWAKGHSTPSVADWLLVDTVAKAIGVTSPSATQRAA